MKKILLITILCLSCSYLTFANAETDTITNSNITKTIGKHAKGNNKLKNVKVTANDKGINIVAVSDTSDEDLQNTAYVQADSAQFQFQGPSELQWLNNFDMGPIIAIIAMVCVFVLPFLLIGFIIWAIFHNRNKAQRERNEILRQMLANGQDIKPLLKREELVTVKPIKTEKGIKNMCLGIGLILFFYILIDKNLTAIGVLVFFVGLGQYLSARYSNKTERYEQTYLKDTTSPEEKIEEER